MINTCNDLTLKITLATSVQNHNFDSQISVHEIYVLFLSKCMQNDLHSVVLIDFSLTVKATT